LTEKQSTGKMEEMNWGWFSVEREQMSIGWAPASTCGQKWGIPRGQGIWPRGGTYFGPWWPAGAPPLAAGPFGQKTDPLIFLEFYVKLFYREFLKLHIL